MGYDYEERDYYYNVYQLIRRGHGTTTIASGVGENLMFTHA